MAVQKSCSAGTLIALATSHSLAAPMYFDPALGGNGHYYEAVLVPEGLTWSEADAAATLAGGHLATITSADENNFVYSLIDSDEFWFNPGDDHWNGPWIGGFQPQGSPEPGGGWSWITGETWDFTAWDPGEPNDSNNGAPEAYLHYFSNLTGSHAPTWNDLPDLPNRPVLGYVVEYVPSPGTMTLIGVLALSAARRKR